MRDLTRQGVAPDPNWPLAPNPNWLRTPKNARRSIEPEPVFQLTRRLHTDSPIPTTMGWRSSSPDQEAGSPDAIELDEDKPIHVPATRRQIAVRCVGCLAIAGAIFGAGLILRSPDALRQAVDWATLGHADAVVHTTP